MSEYIVSMPPDMPYEIRAELNAWYVESEPIVRCRDCEWCVEAGTFYDCEHFACHLYWNESREPDGFCAWGERAN